MSNFQTQSQWENDTQQSTSDSTDRTSKKKGIQVSKKIVAIISALFILVIGSLGYTYLFTRKIEGTWIRQMDDNTTLAGMTVEVRRNGSRLEGVIVSMPAGAESFYVGQVKWFGIRKTGFGQYAYYDLIAKDGGTEYYYGSNIDDMVINADESQLTISSNNDTERGQHQLWVKQK